MRKALRLLKVLLLAFWKTLTVSRRVAANLIFLGFLALVAFLGFGGREPRLPASAALRVAPSGLLVEQESRGVSWEDLLPEEEGAAETVVRDLVEALDLAKDDPRIRAVYLDLSRLGGGQLSKLQAVGAALERFRESKKPVIAAGDYFLQSSYFLAAHADRVYVAPLGGVFLKGYGIYRHYLHPALERLGVKVHVFRAGLYKSAAEPFERSDMSEEDRTANAALLGVLWSAYKEEVARLRRLEPAAIDDYVERFPRHLAAAGGDAAEAARAAGLVDDVRPRHAVREELLAIVGEDPAERSFRQVDVAAYLRARRAETGRDEKERPKVAVIVAQGVLVDGLPRAGRTGSAPLVQQIRRAVGDDAVRALVLRVDSPGGSALAAETVLAELERARLAGKPVIASFGSVAASGGYWIACAADEIWAAPTTVTGSIGVFGLFPSFAEGLQSLGIRNDGVGTTRLADALNPSRPLNPHAAEALRLLVERSYAAFLERVGRSRGLSDEQLRRVAEGRVWSGRHAQENGLVDRLGGIEEAVAAAARRAGLETYAVDYLEPPLSSKEKILRELRERWAGRDLARGLARLLLPGELLQPGIEGFLGLLFKDPRGIHAYCLACEGID